MQTSDRVRLVSSALCRWGLFLFGEVFTRPSLCSRAFNGHDPMAASEGGIMCNLPGGQQQHPITTKKGISSSFDRNSICILMSKHALYIQTENKT